MRSLSLDYIRERRLPGWVGLAVLVAALALSGFLALHFRSLLVPFPYRRVSHSSHAADQSMAERDRCRRRDRSRAALVLRRLLCLCDDPCGARTRVAPRNAAAAPRRRIAANRGLEYGSDV